MQFRKYYIFILFIINGVCSPAIAVSNPEFSSDKFQYANTPNKPAKLAIIMDDIAGKASDELAFSLPRSVTFAILPHTSYSTPFSYKAASQNREVMLHMPMESLHKVNLGPYPLLTSMFPGEVRDTLLHALQTVPHAVGVNNHMGSKLTQMTLQMDSVMQVLASNNLFFIDSRTTKYSRANDLATQNGVKSASRHVFLDHEQNEAFLKNQFARSIRIAREHGKAILIAHPYPITLNFLASQLKRIPADIELITVSEFLQETQKFRTNPHLTMKPKFRLNASSNEHTEQVSPNLE